MQLKGGGRAASPCGQFTHAHNTPDTPSPPDLGPACLPALLAPPALPALQDQDDWVPMDVVRDLVAALYASSAKLLADICPADELNWQEL